MLLTNILSIRHRKDRRPERWMAKGTVRATRIKFVWPPGAPPPCLWRSPGAIVVIAVLGSTYGYLNGWDGLEVECVAHDLRQERRSA